MRSELRQTLKPTNRALMTGCYAWWKSDRTDSTSPKRARPRFITRTPVAALGYPWQTSYGNPDVAWIIYSADRTRTTARSSDRRR